MVCRSKARKRRAKISHSGAKLSTVRRTIPGTYIGKSIWANPVEVFVPPSFSNPTTLKSLAKKLQCHFSDILLIRLYSACYANRFYAASRAGEGEFRVVYYRTYDVLFSLTCSFFMIRVFGKKEE